MEETFHPGFWSGSLAQRRTPQRAMPKPSRAANVKSVPVRFVGSDETERRPSVGAAAKRATPRATSSEAALAIQRTFRGFLVRKNLRLLRGIEAEVDAVDKGLAQAGDRLRRDAGERLRVSETLMALLLRLDSVRGVREYRRRVIRKAIALQEAVDRFATPEVPQEGMTTGDNEIVEMSNEDGSPETPNAQGSAQLPQISLSTESCLHSPEILTRMPGSLEGEDKNTGEEDLNGDHIAAEEFKRDAEGGAGEVIMEEVPSLPAKDGPHIDDVLEEENNAVDMPLKSEDHPAAETMSGSNIESLTHDGGEQEADAADGRAPEEAPSSATVFARRMDMETGQGNGEERGDAAAMRAMWQAINRMEKENRELKGLVVELCGRNDMQLRLMEGLLKRVKRLEKVVETGRRKRQKTT